MHFLNSIATTQMKKPLWFINSGAILCFGEKAPELTPETWAVSSVLSLSGGGLEQVTLSLSLRHGAPWMAAASLEAADSD